MMGIGAGFGARLVASTRHRRPSRASRATVGRPPRTVATATDRRAREEFCRTGNQNDPRDDYEAMDHDGGPRRLPRARPAAGSRPARPTVRTVTRFRHPLAGLAALVVALVALLAPASPASAHAELTGTEPAEGSVVPTAPSALTLSFGEGVETALGAVKVLDATGKVLAVGEPTHPGGDQAKVQVALPALADGTYLVSYRVVSADSHPVQGSFLFSVGKESAVQPSAAAALAGPAVNRTVGQLFGTTRFVVFLAFVAMAGGFAFVVFFQPDHPRIRTVLVVASVVLVIGSLASLALQGAYAAGAGFGEVLKPDVWRETARTAFGRQVMFRCALGAVGLALALVASQLTKYWWQMPALLLGPATAATLAFSGHAHTGRATGLGIAADLVHLVALAWWLGGLVVLAAAAFGKGAESHLIARFSPLAFGCVAAVVASGVAQSWRQVGSKDALTSTRYGQLLITKVVLVGVLLLAAAVVRRTLHRWTTGTAAERATAEAGTPAAGTVGAAAVATAGPAPSLLRRAMLGEIALSLAVLGVTAGLVQTPPAIDQVAAPFNVTLLDQGATANLVVDEVRVGTTGVHLYVTPPGNDLKNRAAEARLELALPSAGVQPLTIALDAAGPNHFSTEAARFPLKGTWQATLIVRFGEFESHTFTTTIKVR